MNEEKSKLRGSRLPTPSLTSDTEEARLQEERQNSLPSVSMGNGETSQERKRKEERNPFLLAMRVPGSIGQKRHLPHENLSERRGDTRKISSHFGP